MLLRGRVLTGADVLPDGLVATSGDRLDYVGPATGYDGAVPPPSEQLILPGLVDVHNHGGGGFSFPDATAPEEVQAAVRPHLLAGTTSLIASLVTAAPQTLLARAELLAGQCEAGVLAGIHAEGPFLSHERRGAQSPDHLLPGDPGFVRELTAAARGHLRTMTVAPEVAGKAALTLAELGVVPSLGHTAGTTEQAETLIAQVAPVLRERGLTMTATHLFNGMPPLHHRQPGPVAACLAAAARGDMVVELVADGVHLSPALVRSLVPLLPTAVAFVTDAMAAAGMPDGDFQLGPMLVTVTKGVARLHTEDGSEASIAGGTSRLLDVIRTSVHGGVALADAVRAATLTPARALGLPAGLLEAGALADVLVVDADLRPVRVFRAGLPAEA